MLAVEGDPPDLALAPLSIAVGLGHGAPVIARTWPGGVETSIVPLVRTDLAREFQWKRCQLRGNWRSTPWMMEAAELEIQKLETTPLFKRKRR